MNYSSVIFLVPLIFTLGCDSSGGGGSKTKNPDLVTIAQVSETLWLQKSDAEELRRTGSMKSLCEEIQKNPNTIVMNMRSIDQDGEIDLYHPKVKNEDILNIGRLSDDGTVVISKNYEANIPGATVRVTLNGDILTFTYSFDQSSAKMDYLRSSEEEALEYYGAQEDCLN